MRPKILHALVRLALLAALVSVSACTQSEDGPLDISVEDVELVRYGYYLRPLLDSGKSIHLVQDTLYLYMDSMWTYSNCALKRVTYDDDKVDSTYYIKPILHLQQTSEDCPSPFYRPSYALKIFIDEAKLEGVSRIIAKSTNDSVFDTIAVRRGNISRDTFEIYVDSIFNNKDSLPLRTKGSPSLLKVLDSITPLEFYWRPMKSKCRMKITDCDSLVTDTLFPKEWTLGDTLLVPVRLACADSDETYCMSSYWENDSSSLGDVRIHRDTVWNTSVYLTESVPACATYDRYEMKNMLVGYTGTFIRELFSPDSSETSCGPLTRNRWMAIRVPGGKMVLDNDSLVVADSLYKAWKKAKVAPRKAKK